MGAGSRIDCPSEAVSGTYLTVLHSLAQTSAKKKKKHDRCVQDDDEQDEGESRIVFKAPVALKEKRLSRRDWKRGDVGD